ncbi:hypothetical protein [Maridesulfovibrio sp.]|uniref:hypothetical protein n=1 Tax=Maridesulfovibrio sp. TaxID=2795000 RepID=UPI002A1875DB|nr:hypothetical protein [Maridesulfovibrio sp.]
MTVVSSGSSITYAGDGTQAEFDFNFRIFGEDDLCAVVRSDAGDETELAPGSDFSIVSGVGSDAGGRIRYPVSGTPLAVGETITLYRNIPYTQELELVDNDPFSAALLNEAFDRGVMRDQQLQEQLDRALKYEITTPTEEQLSPQEFMRVILETGDMVSSSLAGSEAARDQALAAQAAAEESFSNARTARNGAEAAQLAAEEARDSAQAIALGDLADLRSATPVLSGPAEADEGTTLTVLIADHEEDVETSYDLDVSGFGLATVSGNAVTWVLGSLDVDTSCFLEVVRRRRGELYSETARHTVLVKNVVAQDGPTYSFADTTDGYPGATIDGDGVHAPAHTLGVDNDNQLVSAQAEIVRTSDELPLNSGTSATTIETDSSANVSEGDGLLLLVDGESVAAVAGAVTGGAADETASLAWVGAVQLIDGFSSNYTVLDGDAPQGAIHSKVLSGDFTFSAYQLYNSGGSGGGDWCFGFFAADELAMFVDTSYCGNAINMNNWWAHNGTTTINTPDGIVSTGVIPAGDVLKWERIDGIVKFYIDGVLVYTGTTPYTGDICLLIGQYYGGTDSYGTAHWRDITAIVGGSLSIDITSASLASAPTKAFKSASAITLNSGTSATAIVTDGSVSISEGDGLLLLADGASVAAVAGAVTLGSDTLISGATGTIITQMSDAVDYFSVTPENAFDGDTGITTYTQGSTIEDAFPVYLGKLWSTPYTISKVVVTPPSSGFVGSQLSSAATLTIAVEGSNDGTTWIELHSDNYDNDGTAVTITDIIKTSPYLRHRVKLDAGDLGSAFRCWVAEIDFYYAMSIIDITAAGLSVAPTSAAKFNAAQLALGAGVAGEYLGPEVGLEFASSDPIESNESTWLTGNTLSTYMVSGLCLPNGETLKRVGTHQRTWDSYPAYIAPVPMRLGVAKKVADDEWDVITWFQLFNHGLTGFEYIELTEPYTVPDDGNDYRIIGIADSTQNVGYGYISAYDGTGGENKAYYNASGTVASPLTGSLGTTSEGSNVSLAVGYETTVSESTASALVFTSAESIAPKIYTEGGKHNTIKIDGVEHAVSGVSEVDNSSATTTEETGTKTDVSDTAFWSGTGLVVPNGRTVAEIGMANTGSAAVAKVILYRVDTETAEQSTASGSYETVASVDISYSGSGDYEYVALETPYLIPEDGKEYRLGMLLSSGTFSRNDGASGIHSTAVTGVVGQTFTADLDTYQPFVGAKTSDPLFVTTATLAEPLAAAPAGTESVVIPDRCTLIPDSQTTEATSEGVKTTASVVSFENDPDLKRLAMAANGPDGLTFKSGKIYIQEKP